MPIPNGLGDFFKILDRSSEGDCTLWPYYRHTRFQTLEHFRTNLLWSSCIEGLRIVDVSYEGGPIAHHSHGLNGIILGIEMEGRNTRLADEFHSIQRPAANMENQWDGKPLNEFAVNLTQEPIVIGGTDQVSRGMVRKGECVCARFDLRQPKLDGDLFQLVQASLRFGRIIHGHEEEILQTKTVI